MPAKNTVKQFGPDKYYHVYSRGALQKPIFNDSDDYLYAKKLFARHLSSVPYIGKNNYQYPWYKDDMELLCYCFMPNHFHLLIYQSEQSTITKFLRSFCVAYTMYFNTKYNSKGHLFESIYKARPIDSDEDLINTSFYIHSNLKQYESPEHSSLKSYVNNFHDPLLQMDKIITHFNGATYLSQFEIYVQHQKNQQKLLDATQKVQPFGTKG